MNLLAKRKNINPFSELFDDFLSDYWPEKMERRMAPFTSSPTCEVNEDKDSYHFKFDLPGVKKEEIKIDLTENQLTVSGERKEEKSESTDKKKYSEVYYGSFSRSFSFPASVNIEKSEARFENGVLAINVSKQEKTSSRQLTIR